MTQIEYVDDERPRIVDDIQELLTKSEDGVVAVAVCSPSGLNFLTDATTTREEMDEARLQLAGLLDHFDELVAAAQANTERATDVDE